MQYYQNQGIGFTTVLLIILVIAIFILGVLFYLNILTLNQVLSYIGLEKTALGFQKTTTSIKSSQQLPSSLANMIESNTCKKQNIPTLSDDTKPISITRYGYDLVNNCCLDEYRGFLCSREDLTSIFICKTSDVGGKIIYIREDNTFLQPEIGLTTINLLHKSKWNC